MCRLVLLHLLWVLPSACLLLLSLVCELVSVCPFWSRSLTVPQLCCSLLPGWACGARCYLSFWSRSDGICCGELLLTMLLCHLVQASYYLRARTHYVGYCLILLFAHPAFWITCCVEYLHLVALGVQCLVSCCCYECFYFYFESCAFSHQSVSIIHWCDLRYLPFVLSM